MRKITQYNKPNKKKPSQERQEASYRLGKHLDDPISSYSVTENLHDTPINETTYGKLAENIKLPFIPSLNNGHLETDNDFYWWFKALNEHKNIVQPERTVKELADYLTKKAENILPESKQRKVLYQKERETRKNETLEDRINREKKLKRQKLNQKIRIKAIKQRRKEFNLKRPEIILKMLASDMLYECSVHGCTNKDIAIDHIIPIALGGSDDIENLQFLCKSHNSKKGIN